MLDAKHFADGAAFPLVLVEPLLHLLIRESAWLRKQTVARAEPLEKENDQILLLFGGELFGCGFNLG